MTRRQLFKSLVVLAATPLLLLARPKKEIYSVRNIFVYRDEFYFTLSNGGIISMERRGDDFSVRNGEETFKIKRFEIERNINIPLDFHLAERFKQELDCSIALSFVRS